MGGGAAPSWSPADWFQAGEKGLWSNSDTFATTRFQDSAGTTPVTATEQPIGLALDQSGNANNLLQVTSAARPVLKLEGALYFDKFDGIDDGYATATFTAGTLTSDMDCFIAFRRDSAADLVLLNGQAGDIYFGVMAAGGGGGISDHAGSPTVAVNGVDVPGGTAATRGDLSSAVPVGEWCVLEFRNLDLSSWTVFKAGLYPVGYQANGGIAEVILAPAQDAEARTQAREYLAAKAGITL